MQNPRTIYYWFSILLSAGMTAHAAIYVPFLITLGLSLSEIALINVAYWTIIILSEIPTGLFADVRSRAWSLQLGALFHLIGMFVYFMAQGFWTALLAELLVGVGAAFLSGVQSAWIVDALHRRGEESKIRDTFARATTYRAFAALASGSIGALVGIWNLRSAYVIDVVFLAAATVLAFRATKDHGEPITRTNEWGAMKQSWFVLRSQPALIWACAATVLFGLNVPFNHYWSPIFKVQVGQAGLAYIWFMIYGAMALSGRFVRRISSAQGNEWGWIAASLVLAGAGILGLGTLRGILWPLLVVIIHEIGRGAFDPLLDSFTQHRIESSYRATYGSLQSLIGRTGFAATLVGLWLGTRGKPTTLATMFTALVVCGSLLVTFAVLLWLARPRRHLETDSVSK